MKWQWLFGSPTPNYWFQAAEDAGWDWTRDDNIVESLADMVDRIASLESRVKRLEDEGKV